MVEITRDEKDYLESQGFKWKTDIHGSYSKRRTYYATTSKDLMDVLNKYKQSKIIKKYN